MRSVARAVAAIALLSSQSGCTQDAIIGRDPDSESSDGNSVADGRDSGAEDDHAEQNDDQVDVPSRLDALPMGNSPGTGTGTLVVTGEVSATENGDNSREPNDFGTSMVVTVMRGVTPVAGATVIITWGEGRQMLEPTSTPGQYTRSRSGYQQSYVLDVIAGSDRVEGVRVMGPYVHWFTAPESGYRHAAGQPLVAQWTGAGANEALIETRFMPPTIVPDVGSFAVSGMFFRAPMGGDDHDRLQLRRRNRIVPAGGASGSVFAVSVRNAVDFVIGM